MSVRNPSAKWTLPTIIDPSDDLCFVVRVPNERYHIAAFLGALQDLGSWYKWAEDPAHRARLVAKVWRDILDRLEVIDCELIDQLGNVSFPESPVGMWRQNGCKLEFSIDGECWCVVYDPTDCIGEGGTQPSPSERPEPGQCKEIELVIQGTGTLLPIPVEGNDTIEILNARGGWNDGTLQWACPSGFSYGLGICGSPLGPDAGDPMPLLDHMRLIAKIGSSYQDAYNRQILVSSGQSLVDVLLQPNDASLGDNGGSISARVRVCRSSGSSGTWSHDFDFTVDDGGWEPQQSGYAVYSAGVGWINGTALSQELCYIQHSLLTGGTLLTFELEFTTNATPIGYQAAVISKGATELFRDNSLAQSPGGTLVFNGSQGYSALEKVLASVNVNATAPKDIVIVRATLSGLGNDPFV